MTGRRFPRPASQAIRRVQASVAPLTPLAAAQSGWAEIVGPAIAAAAIPVSERRGELIVRCESSVWAQELDLMAPAILARLREATGSEAVQGLRFEIGPLQ
jgi:predicted nucleic acid-binding Zn ribbon protein